MKYCSTRGGVRGATFEECISRGYAPDGGLYVPEALPKLDSATLHAWSKLDFPALAVEIFKLFVGDEMEASDLEKLVRSCYENYSCPEIVPIKRVGALFVTELFHGPTFCFKDLGLQPLVRLVAWYADKRAQRRTMLVATTGDTGPAAMRAVSDVNSPNLEIIVFYPKGQISDLQRKQMTTVKSTRARIVAFEGGGDDMDAPLKRLASDQSFLEQFGLCGINSYNLGRPVSQLVHYFWTYFRVVDQLGSNIGAPVDIVIPTGAMGNMTAGFMAKKMGLPLRRLVAGVNSNDITHRTFTRGQFHRSDKMEKTLSDAINIQVPYNMERIFYYLTGEDSKLVSTWMADMDKTGKLTLPEYWLARLQEGFASCRVDDVAMCDSLRRALDTHKYLADPHTAVGLGTAWSLYGEADTPVPVAVLATASPCKFQASVTEAVGPSSWATYAGSAEFPESGRATLAAAERPPVQFPAAQDSESSQAQWEAAVRRMLTEGAVVSSKL